METVKQARFLAVNYSSLQGLKYIPPSLALLLVTLWANGQSGGSGTNFILPVVFTLGSFALLLPIERYYAHAFGRVKRTFTSYWPEFIMTLITGILVLSAFWVENAVRLPISLLGLALSTPFLYSALVTWRGQGWLSVSGLSMAVLMAAVSLLPLFGLTGWWHAIGMRNHLLGETAILSILMIIAGILSHIAFSYSLPTTAEGNNG